MFHDEALANIVGDVDAFAACWGEPCTTGGRLPGFANC